MRRRGCSDAAGLMSMVYTGSMNPEQGTAMRKFSLMILAAVSLPAAAQCRGRATVTVLYGVRRTPGAAGHGGRAGAANPGIPTSGTQQAQQLKNQPGYGNPGYGHPATAAARLTIYRDKESRYDASIRANGSTVCQNDINGNVTVCN